MSHMSSITLHDGEGNTLSFVRRPGHIAVYTGEPARTLTCNICDGRGEVAFHHPGLLPGEVETNIRVCEQCKGAKVYTVTQPLTLVRKLKKDVDLKFLAREAEKKGWVKQ